MGDKLEKYRSKRDPARTPEPIPEAEHPGDGNAYVIHEHHARALRRSSWSTTCSTTTAAR